MSILNNPIRADLSLAVKHRDNSEQCRNPQVSRAHTRGRKSCRPPPAGGCVSRTAGGRWGGEGTADLAKRGQTWPTDFESNEVHFKIVRETKRIETKPSCPHRGFSLGSLFCHQESLS